MANCKCQNCGCRYPVPAGEAGDHECPRCGDRALVPVAGPGPGTHEPAPEKVREEPIILKANDWMQVEGSNKMICGARYGKLLRDEAVVKRVRKMITDLREQDASEKPDPETWNIVREGVKA